MSMYDLPKLTQQIRQFDRNPGQGETILTAVASPSAAALEAENNSLERAIATGVTHPYNAAPPAYANRDEYRNQQDSASIYKRPDLDEGVL
jgi:hypothetical protein